MEETVKHHHHHHEHSHEHHESSQEYHLEEQTHRSQRAGKNRTTSTQKKRQIASNITFVILTLLAIAIVAFIVCDRMFGLI